MDFLHKNHIHWSGNGPTWDVWFDRTTRPTQSFYEETVKVAEIVWSQKQGNLFLCYSGGLDSEYVLSVFKSLGMPITPVIMRTQYNQHDTVHAYKFCEEHNIKPITINLDFDNFVESGKFIDMATKYSIGAFHVPANLWLTTQIDGTVITGDSDPHIVKGPDDIWFVDEIEPVYSQFKFYADNNIYGTPFFLSYTAEQILSFLIDPTIHRLATNQIPGKTGSHSSKVHVYNNQDKFVLTQRTKQNGYEIMEKNPIFNHPDIQKVVGWKEKWWGTSMHEYFGLIESMTWKP